MSGKRTNTDSSQRRGSRSNYRPWLRLIKRLSIVALVLLVGFLVWNNWEKIAPEAILDWTDQQFGDAQSGEGFPCSISGNTVVEMAEVNQHLAVLSDTTLRFYNANAACVAERTHSFSQPTMHTAGKYVLLTELGGSRIRLETRRETVLGLTLENRSIYAADLLSNGTMALILNSASQSYVSEIQVLNSKGTEQFTYKSNKYLLTDVSLSPGGRQLAAVGTTADNGVLKSVLLVITLSSSEVEEYTGTDVLLHTVTFFSGDAILAVGDREIWSLKGNQVEKTVCEGLEPVGYTSTSSLSGVALRRAGATDEGEVWVFNAKADRIQTMEYNGTYRSVSGRGSKILLLTNEQLYEVNTAGVQAQYEVPSDSLLATTYRGSPLLLTLSEFKRTEN